MTVATELAKRHQRMEYFLCIEGVGWPTSENDLSSGFDGDVFVVDDLDGTLASDLGCTIHHGLSWSGSIGNSINIITGQYGQGQLTFNVQDVDGFLRANYRPLLQGLVTSLDAGVAYTDTTIDITDGTTLDEGDVIWIGGQEAVLLGTKSTISGDKRRYTGSTRGYLGTHRGMLRGFAQSNYGFYWPDETSVYDWMRFWHNRMVDLYMHVPGETVGNCLRIWSGKLRGTERDNVGNEWTLSAVSDPVRDYERTWEAVDMQIERIADPLPPPASQRFQDADRLVTAWFQDMAVRARLSNTQRDRYTEKLRNKYVIAEGYHYRSEPGGTDGMRSTWDSGTTQARTTSVGDAGIIMRFIQIGQGVYLATRSCSSVFVDTTDRHLIQLERFPTRDYNDAINPREFGERPQIDFESGIQCRWLLDHWFDDAETNRFAYNKIVSRNPVDVLLTFLTSRDYETWRGDTHGAAAGTATTPIFASTIGTTNLYAGMALHCVEGDNKGEARVIVSNTTTTITVDEPFSNAPGTSEEYQVRNSIYDTLPVGWGLGVPWYRIDVESFEDIRDKYLSDAEVGRFILGVQDKIDLLKLLRENICGPYGLHFTINRSTGKLTLNYIGLAQGDGVVDDYVAIGEDDIHEISPINYNLEKPVAKVLLKLRSIDTKLMSFFEQPSTATPVGGQGSSEPVPAGGDVKAIPPPTMGGETYELPIAQGELLDFTSNGTDEAKLTALFNTVGDDKTWLINRANLITKFFAVPPPTVELKIDISFALTVTAGTMVSLTKTGVANPFSISNGWTDVVGVVTKTQLSGLLDAPSMRITVVLLQDINGGRIAPAAKLSGSTTGTDGTSDYFIVAPTTYTVTTDDKDYYGFAVGDKINLYDSTGAVYAGADPGPYTISGFGANNSQTPEGASTDIIRIAGTVASGTVTTSHYLTLADWSAANTARMEQYAAYADASAGLTGGDEARTYS